MNNKNEICLVLGDWSHDGHSQTEPIWIKSNLTTKEIEKAYIKGTTIIGFNLCKDIACDYEDSSISREIIDILKSHGFSNEIWDEDYKNNNDGFDDDEGVSLDTGEFADIYLFIVKLGNPSFDFKIIEDNTPKINIGGYGLFYG